MRARVERSALRLVERALGLAALVQSAHLVGHVPRVGLHDHLRDELDGIRGEWAQRTEPARQERIAPAVAIEHLECLDGEMMRLLEVLRVGEDRADGELLRRLALARRARSQAREDALRVGRGSAGQQLEAVELRREVVDQETRLGLLACGVLLGVGHPQTLDHATRARRWAESISLSDG